MEIFLEFLKEALKGITRALSAHLFQKAFLDEEKTTSAVTSIRVVLENLNNF